MKAKYEWAQMSDKDCWRAVLALVSRAGDAVSRVEDRRQIMLVLEHLSEGLWELRQRGTQVSFGGELLCLGSRTQDGSLDPRGHGA